MARGGGKQKTAARAAASQELAAKAAECLVSADGGAKMAATHAPSVGASDNCHHSFRSNLQLPHQVSLSFSHNCPATLVLVPRQFIPFWQQKPQSQTDCGCRFDCTPKQLVSCKGVHIFHTAHLLVQGISVVTLCIDLLLGSTLGFVVCSLVFSYVLSAFQEFTKLLPSTDCGCRLGIVS